MEQILHLIAVVSIFVVCANGQVLRSGSCPKVAAMPDFEIKKFMGIWYEQVHTKRWSGDLRCSVEHFSQTGPRTFFINSFTFSPSVNRSYQIKGNAAYSEKTGNEGLMEVEILELNLNGTVWVLQTDYKSFAVIWSCKNAQSKYFENVIIMTRDKHAKSGPILNGLAVLTSRKIMRSSLTYVSHSDCPNYDGLLDEINKTLNSTAAEKIAPNSEIAEIDIRLGQPPHPAMAN